MNKVLHSNWLLAVLLATLTLAVFWPATGFEFINMDDDVYVTANAHVLGGLSAENVRWAFAGLHAGFWHPVTWLSLQADATMWGMGAAGFHRTNILLHTANTVLVFLLLFRLSRSRWRSALVAALFALHPLRVEVVAWVSERKELLGALFSLLALWAYAGYAQIGKSNWRNYVLTLVFFTLALMSKPMAVMLPLVMLLLDVWPLRRNDGFAWRLSNWGLLLLEKIPFFVLALAMGVVTLYCDFHFVAPTGELMPLVQHPWPLRLENAAISFVRYLLMTFWPMKLAPLYPYPTAYAAGMVVGAVGLLLGISLLVLQARRAFWAVGWFWYLLMLLPAIGLIQVGPHSHADRYTYLPQIGLLLALVWGVAALLEKLHVSRVIAGVAAILVLGVCVALTRGQLDYWRNSGVLFARTAAVTENNAFAHALCGHYLAEHKQTDAAIVHFLKAIEIMPRYADAWNNLGLAVAAKGRREEAMADFRKAIEVSAAHEGAWNNLGLALAGAGRTAEAMECYRRVLAINPSSAATSNNLGYLLAGQGKWTEAIPYYEAAVREQPHEVGFRLNLGAALMNAGRQAEGVAQYREALRQNPALTEVRDFLKSIGAGS